MKNHAFFHGIEVADDGGGRRAVTRLADSQKGTSAK